MKKISSRSTFFNKVFFPIIWLGLCVGMLAIGIWGSLENPIDWMFMGAPLMFMIVGYVVMKALIFDLMDEVFDAGDSLIVRNKGRDIRVALKDIKNVSYQVMSNPQRVTLSLRKKIDFGQEISFTPVTSLWAFKKNRDILALIDRIDETRGS
ncbi:hypothetical protein MHM98_08445 [Psychrobium sp. MM17-31]|uniref:hypothetical protein n=1 Tax=Psychrobium sp. MM17-31 TaxID=2917758 RepID=UPI001EF51506|nr:hypothetical protein [Psychrobium sp. MM17-31]MCG7531377.1 hypothetical protein [Psychrobium sp. MM17-31]